MNITLEDAMKGLPKNLPRSHAKRINFSGSRTGRWSSNRTQVVSIGFEDDVDVHKNHCMAQQGDKMVKCKGQTMKVVLGTRMHLDKFGVKGASSYVTSVVNKTERGIENEQVKMYTKQKT